ncbi:ABC transporter permease, partial [Pseudoruegeria sp. M32A2M]|nr:ABC transporter permease [Pseudoruegeria sp. M32A2M]
VALHNQNSPHSSLASALAYMLLVAVLLLYWLYDRLLGIDNLKLG